MKIEVEKCLPMCLGEKLRREGKWVLLVECVWCFGKRKKKGVKVDNYM